jgi:hypothetical protein
MPHLVLLGDSIFDNAQHTGGSPDVASQLRKLLPSGWGVSLLAVDGSTTLNIPDQMRRLPILRVAIERGIPVIDLRSICTDPTDYANPIEPSSIGGEKIARVIVALLTGSRDHVRGTRILAGS